MSRNPADQSRLRPNYNFFFRVSGLHPDSSSGVGSLFNMPVSTALTASRIFWFCILRAAPSKGFSGYTTTNPRLNRFSKFDICLSPITLLYLLHTKTFAKVTKKTSKNKKYPSPCRKSSYIAIGSAFQRSPSRTAVTSSYRLTCDSFHYRVGSKLTHDIERRG